MKANHEQYQWDDKKIRNAEPQALVELIKEYATHINGLIADRRGDFKLEEMKIFLQEIIEKYWGPWSHRLNKIVRERTTAANQFIENDDQRFLAKQLSTTYLYWNKQHRYIESLFVENIIANSMIISQRLREVEQIYRYFYSLEKIITPTFVENENE